MKWNIFSFWNVSHFFLVRLIKINMYYVAIIVGIWTIRYSNLLLLEVPIYTLSHTCDSAISAYHYYSCEFEPRSWRDVLDTTLCNKVCQWLVTGRWFSPGIPVSSTNKTDHHDVESGVKQHNPNQTYKPFVDEWYENKTIVSIIM
jgi:hypothetical protein